MPYHQMLRSMGITGKDQELLTLLRAADWNIERAVNQ
jgi:hypothetical protein